ncbi:MAG: electron transport complex protein RnfA [Candidatus Oxydemutatoraceae bacterium WSBS_2016_MAG_OTU14]
MSYFLIIISTALVNNFVLTHFLGLCPFFGVRKNFQSAVGMTLATVFVLTLSSGIGYLLYTYLLVPLEIEYLKGLVFILVIASLVQLTEIVLRAIHPLLHSILSIFLPLITTNCAVLSVALLNAGEQTGFFSAILTGLGAGLGFSLVLIVFASLHTTLEDAAIMRPLRGSAMAMITAGIMALAFNGFAGITL